MRGLLDLYGELYTTKTSITINGTSHVRLNSGKELSLSLLLQLEFPAVTICNQNRINCAQLSEELEEKVDNESAAILNWLRTNACKKSLLPWLGNGKPSAPKPSNASGTFGDTSDYLLSEYSFLRYYMSLNRTIRTLIGHQFSSFIKFCTFRGKNCLHNRFELISLFHSFHSSVSS